MNEAKDYILFFASFAKFQVHFIVIQAIVSGILLNIKYDSGC